MAGRLTGRGRRLGRWLRRRPRLLIGVAAAAVAVAVVVVTLALGPSAVPIAPKGAHGYDVAWPQCSGTTARNMPPGNPPYVILGLSDVNDHSANPCLASQVGWARSHGVRVGAYLLASYPTKQQISPAVPGQNCGTSMVCRLRADGMTQARQALATMTSAGILPSRVWIDVEVRRINPWSRRPRRNVALLRGIVHGLRAGGAPTGIYTTSYQWNQITGGLRLDVPNWLPVGDEPPSAAQAMCDSSATGGVTWLVQYTQALDSDLTCPPLESTGGAAQPNFRLSRIARPL